MKPFDLTLNGRDTKKLWLLLIKIPLHFSIHIDNADKGGLSQSD
jgi:hypothetical protein